MAAAIMFMAVRAGLKPTPDAWMLGSPNNPDNFFLWTTNGKVYQHTFTYDPHAADDWLFEFAPRSPR